MSSLPMPAAEGRRGTAHRGARRLGRAARWVWQRPWLALPFLAVPVLLPLLVNGLPVSEDGPLHLFRLVLLDRHMRQGTFFPRWMPELFQGLGYPLLNFYSPLVYYLVEFFYLVGRDITSAFVAAYAILVLAAGAGMYLFALDVFGSQRRWPALVAATAYMYAPYLLTNLYIRGAIAELGAQAWLPWVFWSTRRLLTAERPSQYVVLVALTMGGLAVTHNITLLFAPVVLGCYILLLWWRTGRDAPRIAWMTLAIAAAVGISAFFWLPLITERRFLAETAYQTTATALLKHSWTWRTFVNPSVVFQLSSLIPFRIGLVQLTLALAGIIVAGRSRRRVAVLYPPGRAHRRRHQRLVRSCVVEQQDPADRPVPLATLDIHDTFPFPLHRWHPAASSPGQPPVCRRGCVGRFGRSHQPAAHRWGGCTGGACWGQRLA